VQPLSLRESPGFSQRIDSATSTLSSDMPDPVFSISFPPSCRCASSCATFSLGVLLACRLLNAALFPVPNLFLWFDLSKGHCVSDGRSEPLTPRPHDPRGFRAGVHIHLIVLRSIFPPRQFCELIHRSLPTSGGAFFLRGVPVGTTARASLKSSSGTSLRCNA